LKFFGDKCIDKIQRARSTVIVHVCDMMRTLVKAPFLLDWIGEKKLILVWEICVLNLKSLSVDEYLEYMFNRVQDGLLYSHI